MAESSCAPGTGIAGCVFSLHAMSDRFVDLILGALRATDTSRVWTQTDKVSTTVRGKLPHVFDAVHAMTAELARSGVHCAMNATFSFGCPGDTQGHAAMDADDERPLQAIARASTLPVAAKFALYPMGGGDYMATILREIDRMKETGIGVELVHYCTRLEGPLDAVFDGLEAVFAATAAECPHTVMTLSVSANSPTAD